MDSSKLVMWALKIALVAMCLCMVVVMIWTILFILGFVTVPEVP